MTPSVIVRVFAVGLVITMLGSCGGGGGGASGTQPLTITADSPPPGTTGQVYPGYTFMDSGGTPPLTWSSQTTPPGLTLSISGQLSGTPVTAGTYSMTVTANDSSVPPLAAHAEVSVKINDSPIVIAPAAPPAGIVGAAYAGFAFSASGGSPPYTWQPSGTVPPGLAVGSDGTVSGTPTQAGSFSFSVTATDSAQTPTPSPPLATQIVVNAAGALFLDPAVVPPPGVVGTPYGPFAFTAGSGVPPLHWSTKSGNLPPDLALGQDGSLSGTPTQVGNFAFTILLTDSATPAATSSAPFSISISSPPPPTINSVELPTATVGTAYSYGFSASDGLAPLNWSEAPLLGDGLSLTSDGNLSGTPTAPGKFPISVEVTDSLSRKAPPLGVVMRISLPHSGSFATLPAQLVTPRSGHAATLLKSGKVLITGGGNGVADNTAELYDPATETFAATTGVMTEARIAHTATLLGDSALANYGKVLILGSTDTSVELYDPATDIFTATGSMIHERTAPTATLLASTGANAGKVLVVGGNAETGVTAAELYDPATGKFTTTGSTTILRVGHTATLLTAGPRAGQVLIAGGGSPSAELYNPATETFTPTGDMTVARTGHAAVALGAHDDTQNGDVLIIGTDGHTDLYDSSAGTFSPVGSYLVDTVTHSGRTATLRSDGTVLAAGGYYGKPVYRLVSIFPGHFTCAFAGVRSVSTASSGLFAPESDGFTGTTSLNASRDGHTATLLGNGAVLVAGGTRHTISQLGLRPCSNPPPTQLATALSSAELFK